MMMIRRRLLGIQNDWPYMLQFPHFRLTWTIGEEYDHTNQECLGYFHNLEVLVQANIELSQAFGIQRQDVRPTFRPFLQCIHVRIIPG